MARNFNGSGDKVQFDNPNIGVANGFTVGGWFRFETFHGNGPCLISYGNGNQFGNDRGFALTLSPDKKVRLTTWIGGGGQGVEGTTVLTAGPWYFIVGTKDEGSGAQLNKGWLNGVEEASSNTDPCAVPNSTDDFIIGATQPEVVGTFSWGDHDGDASHCFYYTARLTDAEILALYRGADPRTIRRDSLKVYAPLYGVHSSEPSFAPATQLITGTVTGTTKAGSAGPGMQDPLFSASVAAEPPPPAAPDFGLFGLFGLSGLFLHAAPGALVVVPSGIASLETFGTSKLNLQVRPTGVASLEAFGTTVLQPGSVSVVPSAITSAEAFGSPSVNQSIAMAGIASAEAFGAAKVNEQISVAGISSAEAFGTSKLNLQISGSGIASAEAFGSVVVAAAGSTLVPTGIASLEAFGSTTVVPGSVSILVSGIASVEAFGTAILRQQVRPASIASEEAFGSAKLNQLVSVLGVGSGESFGTAIVSSAAGSQAVQPASISSAEAFGGAKVNSAVPLSGIASGEAFGSATVIPGTISLSVGGIASGFASGAAIVSVGPVSVLLGGIASLEAFGGPSVVPGVVQVQPGGIDSLEAFGNTTILNGLFIIASGIVSAEGFGSPFVRFLADQINTSTDLPARLRREINRVWRF